MAENDAGNVAALREALDALERWVRCHGESYHWSGVEIEADIVRERDEALAKARAALAAPPRNFDVGTAEEQNERFIKFCDSHYSEPLCSRCPLREHKHPACRYAWAKMPYEAEGGDKCLQ